MEAMLFADNLDSQTTETFMKIFQQNGTKRHLGVTNVTDVTHLVEMGLVRRSFMPGTTRTGRDGSREG
jgi:hypothetical protein